MSTVNLTAACIGRKTPEQMAATILGQSHQKGGLPIAGGIKIHLTPCAKVHLAGQFKDRGIRHHDDFATAVLASINSKHSRQSGLAHAGPGIAYYLDVQKGGNFLLNQIVSKKSRHRVGLFSGKILKIFALFMLLCIYNQNLDSIVYFMHNPIAPARTIYRIPSAQHSTTTPDSGIQRVNISQRAIGCLPDQRPNEWEMVNGELVPLKEAPND